MVTMEQLKTMRKITICMFVAVILMFIVGACLFGFSWLMRYEIEKVVDDGIVQAIVVDSTKSDGYQAWQNNYDHGHAILYYDFYLYNITNLDEIKQGINTQVHVKQLGPYTYSCKKLKIDVEFSDGGNEVLYSEWNQWYFQPQLSCAGCSENDTAINLNPGYMAAVGQSGNEELLWGALAGPLLKADVFDFMWNTWIPDVVSEWRPPILRDAIARALNASTSQREFYETWANSTTQTGVWEGLTISPYNNGAASEISYNSAQALLSTNHAYSLLSYSTTAATMWRLVQQQDKAAMQQASTLFNVTQQQVTVLGNWLTNGFDATYTNTNLTTTWNVSTVQDLAYLQWSEGTVSGGISLMQLYPEAGFPQPPEFALWWRQEKLNPAASLSWEDTKKLWANPTTGLFIAKNLQLLVNYAEQEDWNMIKFVWGLDLGSLIEVAVYAADFAYEYSYGALGKLINDGDGLFTTRNIHQWLWDYHDPLVSLLDPANSQTALIINETTIEQARLKNKYNVAYTGKNDIYGIGKYKMWKNVTSVDIYATTLDVTGVNDAGQFRPYLDDNTVLHAWDDNYVRDMSLVHAKTVEIKGVTAHRYELSNNTWLTNATMYQSIYGYCNLTNQQHGAPVFITNPHNYLSDQKYFDKLVGVVRNLTQDTVVIDIEPNTGTVINYFEGLQINLFLDQNHELFKWYYPDLIYDFMYPVMIAIEYSTLTDKDADKVTGQLYLGIKMESVIFWVFLGVGLGLVLLSIPACGLSVWKYRRDRRALYGDYQVLDVNN